MAKDIKANIYKYASPNNIEHLFNAEGNVSLKFSLPSDFNDLFELFLTIDFNRDPDDLAYYLDLIGDNLSFPTTCFSISPVVVPMWAHYSMNHQGFVIEFSENKMREVFPNSHFRNVRYSDVPVHDLSDLLTRARVVMKYRYNACLWDAIYSSAYFTKTTCWTYEQERRMVVNRDEVQKKGDLMLLSIPSKAVNSIMCGARATADTVNKIRQIADDIGCRYLELSIGKSSATPFLVDARGDPFTFDQGEIIAADYECEECREPTAEGVQRCSWCCIDDDARERAAQSNSFRLLDHLGLLESYIRNRP